MKCIAIYRFPREGERCRYMENDDRQLDVMHRPGCPTHAAAFVFAPFEQGEQHPLVCFDASGTRVIGLDEAERMECPVYGTATDAASPEGERTAYAADFAAFHLALQRGQFDKLVLARSHTAPTGTPPHCMQLFAKAVRQNPNCFVALVSTPLTGTWITATPETLVQLQHGRYRTMALAGTQPFDPAGGDGALRTLRWNDKNRREQACVADYLRRRLEAMGIGYAEGTPTTVRAGSLAHIKTDFTFAAASVPALTPLQIAMRLHPTPAVCGLPATEAKRFILQHEHTDRRYYSGFCGPTDTAAGEAHLFVTLRCMRIGRTHCTLYAGGGLLAESAEEDEWTETANKMLAMRKVLAR